MRIECDDNRRSIHRARMLRGSRNHCLMSAMNAIEDADREKKGTAQALELGNRLQDFHYRFCAYAPRMRETCGRERMRRAISPRGRALICSTVIAFSTSNRPDFVRRKDFKCAPQPSASPMSCA